MAREHWVYDDVDGLFYKVINGTSNTDSIQGDLDNNLIHAKRGNDGAWGGEGIDKIYGGYIPTALPMA